MTAKLRTPPGRAGRLWLSRRLATAHSAAGLLDRKLRILRTEQERFTMLAERTGRAWDDAARQAEDRLVRAALLGGQRELRLGAARELAEVHLTWGSVMGARYPVTAECRTPDAPAGRRGPGTAALLDAERAHVAALQAAVTHAAATAAQRTIDNEVRETRRRLHAIADRWIPRLDAALHEATQRIEESERAEALGLRWAARRDEEDDHDLPDPARG